MQCNGRVNPYCLWIILKLINIYNSKNPKKNLPINYKYYAKRLQHSLIH